MTMAVGTERLELTERVKRLDAAIRSQPPALCSERAVLVTRYFRGADSKLSMTVRKAEALSYLLAHKRVSIHPEELLVGCFTSHRVGGGLYPELHGVAMMEDLFRFHRREVNPFSVRPEDRRALLREVLPYWLLRFLALRAFRFPKAISFIRDQLSPVSYLINETGGVSHFVPNYQGLITRGTEGYRREIEGRLREVDPAGEAAEVLRGMDIVCRGLETFAGGYAREARDLAREETDRARREELEGIAETCAWVPRRPARTFAEALQAMLFAQIALNLESLDNAVSPGRLDVILQPLYERDVAEGRLDRRAAFELLGCFALKLCEIVPVFSQRVTRIFGGMFNGQVVVVGGCLRDGSDSTNAVTHLFLELMDLLRTRQPNYHARLHRGSPSDYRSRIGEVLAAGAVSPAVYNDEVIVPLLERRGVSREDARDYATVGCVEPVAAGRSFFSTDAALANLPLCLELALNQGRRFGHWRRLGAATRPAEECRSLDELFELFRTQVEHLTTRLLSDLQAIERANARWHPTPLTSLLLEGCLASGTDASSGGATYNASGVQGVGAVEVGDSLAALQTLVFVEGRASMEEVVSACRADFAGCSELQSRLRQCPKYGNDDQLPDSLVGRVMEIFASRFDTEINTRGGRYAAGFYSVTAHQAFGEEVGALPSGRKAGEPFSSGLSPGHGRDRLGPTATICSQARLPLHLAENGINFNLQLAPWAAGGSDWVQGLVDGGFAAGAMQMQINVLDPQVLIEARDNPGRHPGLLVRVSGYSAYFDDLSPEMKQEVIDRTMSDLGGTR